MSSTIPNQLKVDLLTGVFGAANCYAHLVTAVPTVSAGTVAGLTLVSGGNYAAVDLINRAIAADSGDAKLTFDNPVWTSLYAGAATAIVGAVLVVQAGGSKVSTDKWFSFCRLTTASTVASCTITSGSVVITTTGDFSSFAEGQAIEHANLPAGTNIREITSSTQIIVTREATAGGSGATVTIRVPQTYTPQTTIGAAQTCTVSLPTIGVVRI